MPDRQVIEWDKDDIDALKFMKVDCLALGMLTAMKRGFDLLAEHKGITMNLASIPPEDPRTYAMIRAADTLGAFQIESRARSEEHTSELQSIMRISYAVFCLKKKTQHITQVIKCIIAHVDLT